MELVKGVNLHFIPTSKYKTNRIKVRFSGPMSEEKVAGRVLTASMLETANRVFPTSQAFRERLATLYGADFTTTIFRRGLVHYLDIDMTFVRDLFLSRKNQLTSQILDFLRAALFHPLKEGEGFDSATFEIEKKNLLLDLEAEKENHFYHAHIELNKLFYADERMQIPRIARLDLVEKETAETSFTVFQEMLTGDLIDIFFVGDFNEPDILESLQVFDFQPRSVNLSLQYKQEFSTIVREGFEKRNTHQSILELAYHFPIQYAGEGHLALILINGLLGGFAHSKLFVNVREKEGLAYTISSQFDIFSGFMRLYAGIDRSNRTRAFSLMNRQVSDIKRGKFTEQDLAETKAMIKTTTLLAQDRQTSLLERAYLSSIFGNKVLPLEKWLTEIDNISKDDVVAAAQDLKLQAVYFMEGSND